MSATCGSSSVRCTSRPRKAATSPGFDQSSASSRSLIWSSISWWVSNTFIACSWRMRVVRSTRRSAATTTSCRFCAAASANRTSGSRIETASSANVERGTRARRRKGRRPADRDGTAASAGGGDMAATLALFRCREDGCRSRRRRRHGQGSALIAASRSAKVRGRRAVSSVGRASPLHGEGRRFEPVTAHQGVTALSESRLTVWLDFAGLPIASFGHGDVCDDGNSVPCRTTVERTGFSCPGQTRRIISWRCSRRLA